MKRIICIGNRYDPNDDAGPRVYDALLKKGILTDIEVIDGGLAGLNLLPFFETAKTVVIVDHISAGGSSGEMIVLKGVDALANGRGTYDHSSGVGYLLKILPRICGKQVPEIYIVGIFGHADSRAIETAAEMALKVARQDMTKQGGLNKQVKRLVEK